MTTARLTKPMLLMSSVHFPRKPRMMKPPRIVLISGSPELAAYGAKVYTRKAPAQANTPFVALASFPGVAYPPKNEREVAHDEVGLGRVVNKLMPVDPLLAIFQI